MNFRIPRPFRAGYVDFPVIYAEIYIMPARVPFKYSILMLLGGLITSAGIVFLLNFLLGGPKLGIHYDFLLTHKRSPVVSHEILIIETDEFVEGSDIFTVFMALTEMEAANLVMTGKLSPSSSPIMLTEAQIRRRFIDEYTLIGANIRNLFEGIRMGSVLPVQAPSYVERVVELTELGRDRLISVLVDRDEDLIRSVAVFGNYLEVETPPLLDWDGVLRRVRPIGNDFEEAHPVFLNLRNRFITSHIEETAQGQILWLLRSDRQEFDIPLDRNGNIITAWNSNFRVIDISLFREYEEAENTLRDILAAANESGIFSVILPGQTGFEQNLFELSPFIIGEYAFALREELLRTQETSAEQTVMSEGYPSVSENRNVWRMARADYLKSLDDFLNSSAEMHIINRYEEQIADTDQLNEEELAILVDKRNHIIGIFTQMRSEYNRFSAVHSTLDRELKFSYCIMGPRDNARYSALIANALITGSHINPAYSREILIYSIVLSSIVLIIISFTRPVILLFAGLLLSVLSASVFAVVFIHSSYWIDPVIVLGSSSAGMFVIFYCKCTYLKRRTAGFKAAYGAIVPKDFLQTLTAYGRPRPSEINQSYAAIIAIKNINLLRMENNEKIQDAGTVRKEFLASVKEAIFNAGAVIVGFEGDTILACFGSPLELQPGSNAYKWSDTAKSYNPIDKACALVMEFMKDEKKTWCFGIDAGDCIFYWSQETGYSANGRPAVRARILAAKAARIKAKVLITDVVRNKIDMDSDKFVSLCDKNNTVYTMNNG